MMRLPAFAYAAPRNAAEAVKILAVEGPDAEIVAGGTDLYPNMKRRQREPRMVVSLRRIEGLKGLVWGDDGSLHVGASTTLRELERDRRVREELPGLRESVVSISTPVLRNMGTIGGNVCLDTRCYYLNQSFEWRRAIDHCLKCGGDTCWTAPGGTRCWAVNSADTVPVMMALGAKYRLLGPDGEREIDAAAMYDIDDGREWLTRRPGELLTAIVIPPQGAARCSYRKLRRRDAFDFPVLGVAARVERDNGTVTGASIVLNAVGPAPVVCDAAAGALVGSRLCDDTIREAALLAPRAAKPLDNTDHMPSYRKRMIRVFVGRALKELA